MVVVADHFVENKRQYECVFRLSSDSTIIIGIRRCKMERIRVESAVKFFDSLSMKNEPKGRSVVKMSKIKKCVVVQTPNLIEELESALDLLNQSTENLQKPPDLLLPPDVEAKQILEKFRKEVSPYNTFTIPKDVIANEMFRPTFQMFPEVRRSFRKIEREVKSYMKPKRMMTER